MRNIHRRLGLAILLAVLALPRLQARLLADNGDASTGASDADAYQRIAAAFLAGHWENLEADIKTNAQSLAALPAAQAKDVAYIRTTLAECHPEWWDKCKSGKKILFDASVWGQTLNTTFDPAGRGVQFKTVGNTMYLTVSWDTKDMDNPNQAEHGYTKGELCNLGVWWNMGAGQAYSTLPMESFMNLDERGKAALTRFVDFRGDVTGVYYGTPRARRWGLWLYLAGYMDKYSKMVNVMSRQAVGTMFADEVVSHRAAYPSIKLPEKLADKNPEAALALKIKDWIEGHGWTVAEDQRIREAVKKFAMANDQTVAASGVVTLPNGLPMALDPALDGPNREKREAWLKSHFDNSQQTAP